MELLFKSLHTYGLLYSSSSSGTTEWMSWNFAKFGEKLLIHFGLGSNLTYLMHILPEDLYTMLRANALYIGVFVIPRTNQKRSYKDLLIVPLGTRYLDCFQTALERGVGLCFNIVLY
jgi:hypothetical protein